MRFKIHSRTKKKYSKFIEKVRHCYKFRVNDCIKVVRGKFKGTIDTIKRIVGDYVYLNSLFKSKILNQNNNKKTVKAHSKIHSSNLLYYDIQSKLSYKKIVYIKDTNQYYYYGTNQLARDSYQNFNCNTYTSIVLYSGKDLTNKNNKSENEQ